MYWIHKAKKLEARSQKPVEKTRRRSVILAPGSWVLASLLAAGCAHRENSPTFATEQPIQPDQAMQARDWPQVTADYPNGAVAAGPTEFNYEPKRNMPEWKYVYADTGSYFVNMALLPYNLLKHPQWTTAISRGETVPPTYTAQPVLPPAAIAQPSTPPVIEEQGATPSTPKVVEPGAMEPPVPSTPEPPAPPAPPSNESAPAPSTPMIVPAPTAPAAPAPETTPAPTTPTAPAPAPESAPAPAPQATPAPAAEPAPAPGESAPSTPRVIEPPPPQATRNLAPAIHLEPQSSPSTQPVMNK